jgi:hypothetical protein
MPQSLALRAKQRAGLRRRASESSNLDHIGALLLDERSLSDRAANAFR